jgi:hypothetical protein
MKDRKYPTCCCPSELMMVSSPSFLQDRFQFPTTTTSSEDLLKIGKVAALEVTAARARCAGVHGGQLAVQHESEERLKKIVKKSRQGTMFFFFVI